MMFYIIYKDLIKKKMRPEIKIETRNTYKRMHESFDKPG